ncbi:hypothetical protein TSUD_133530 [Trifolium subterraneum]|uniref:RNase H type-1 domain-containing protein n=1 Tax=Trifolium subterraneum TaxID=3900 RepID=A0A2Z6PFL8_TRISU|nr:hypothetical protein TSUD_133530 [Trifolium subterraneum]
MEFFLTQDHVIFFLEVPLKINESRRVNPFQDWSEIDILANQVLYVDIHDIEMRVRDVYIDDCFTWKGNLNGLYTARDGYHWLNRNDFSENPTNVVSWSWLWHIPAPEKIKFFLWTALHKALPTKAMLSHRGILHDSSCPRCNNNVETTIHCLRDCDFAKNIWKSIGFTKSIFFEDAEWFGQSLQAPVYSSDLITTPNTKLVKWNALGSSGMILNVDGSSIGNPGVSRYGGLIRNSEGAWAHGFAGNIGFSNILHPELMALYRGLLLAWQLNIKELWCYSDSEAAIKLIKDILAREWRVNIAHTFREGNACVDYLAKLGARNNEAFYVMASPPAGLNLLLLADASGTWFPR